MKDTEKKCTKCEEVNLVSKSYNCNKCGVWNKFEEEEKPKEKGKKGWLG